MARDTAFLVVTERCNLHCPYCFHEQESGRLTGAEMSMEEWRECCAQLRRLGVGKVIITGGEPLLRADLPALLAACQCAGFSILLLSNGLLLDAGLAAILVSSGVRSVTISLNRLVDIENEGEFRRLLQEYVRIFSILKGAGIAWLSAIAVISRRNAPYVAELHEWCSAAGIGLLIQPVYCAHSGWEHLDLAFFNDEEWFNLERGVAPWIAAYGTQRYWSLVRSLFTSRPLHPGSCWMGREAMVVQSDGTALPCFHRRDLLCGSLLSDSFESIHRRLNEAAEETGQAACFGVHCVSLFMHY
ncbi:radical SAM protein [bacterium]|nr:radical SAM protein [candidate division CSSED10-310 bacterium]